MRSESVVVAMVMMSCGLPPKQQALADVKTFIQNNLTSLATQTQAVCNAAPSGTASGWNASADRAAIEQMKNEWKKHRPMYERVEGAIAILFPELDVSFDERYDGFVETAPDTDLFDDQGVTGNHAIERILWSDATPTMVKQFEAGLGNRYVEARFPQTAGEAQAFKEKLCARFVNDAARMRDDMKPLALDTSSAFRGVVGSIEEQVEKADRAATGEEESRYSQITLADMRANLEGGQKTYEAFAPWLLTTANGKDLDARIRAGFARLQSAYDAISGDALPPVPSTWSSQNPSAADQATPFGVLFMRIRAEADPKTAGSLVSDMNLAADALGIPQLPN